MTETLYRRPLPGDAIPFGSDDGRRLFGEALAAGGLGGYFALAEQYHTQSDPAFCGLSSLVVALNALAIDPGRLWKGPWRWFSEELLDCCVSLEEVRLRGVDLDTVACLARCNRADAEVARPGADAATLRAAIADACAAPGTVIIAGYDRSVLGQTGAGHFSPIGGYHAARDLVLVLDVARFKYPPHWIALDRLDAAMRTIDPSNGLSRGWVRLRRRAGADGVSLSLACAGDSWRQLAARLRAALTAPWSADTSLATIAASLAELTNHCMLRRPDAPDHAAAVARAVDALRATEAYRIAGDEATAALLLLFAREHAAPPGPLADGLARLAAEAAAQPLLAAELDQLGAQSQALRALAFGP